jgi:hypothetical protein
LRFSIGVTAAEARAQFDPSQMKYGTAAVPDPLALLNPLPVTALQIAVASATARRTSRPFSFGP